jgi:hypothetical protein
MHTCTKSLQEEAWSIFSLDRVDPGDLQHVLAEEGGMVVVGICITKN